MKPAKRFRQRGPVGSEMANGIYNIKKCKVMHVGRRNDYCEYYMGGSKLVEETLEKDLGVWISADMKCSQQCRYAVNKANKVLGMIKRTIIGS